MRRSLLLSFILVLLAGCAFAAQKSDSPTVTITGAVKKPGVYPYKSGEMLSDLLKAVEGPALDSWLRIRVSFVRAGKPVRKLSAATMSMNGSSAQSADGPHTVELKGPKDFELYPGDAIYVYKVSMKSDAVITRYFKDVPFADAVASILKGTGYQFSIEPNIAKQNLTVTAAIKNTPVESALNSVAKAAGAEVSIEANVVHIHKAKAWLGAVYAQQAEPSTDEARSPRKPAENPVPAQPSSNRAPTKSETIDLSYVQAGDVLPLVSQMRDVQAVRSTTGNQLVITAPETAIVEAKKTVAEIDNPNALLRPVRIGITATVSVNGKKYSCGTQSLAIEGVSTRLNLSANEIDVGNGRKGRLDVTLSATPTLLQSPVDGKDISLVGSGRISGSLPMKFSKDFDFSVCLQGGIIKGDVGGARFKDEQDIASGKLSVDGEEIGFQVTLGASVEAGRIVTPSSGQMYGAAPAPTAVESKP